MTDGVVSGNDDAAKKVSYADLIGGQVFQCPSRLERQIRQPALRTGQGQAERRRRTTTIVGQPTSRATTSRRKCLRNRFRHRRQSARHDAWPHDPAGRRRRRPGRGRRKLDQATFPACQGGLGQGLPRRRRRPRNGTRSRPRRRSRSLGRTRRRRSPIRRRSTITSAPRTARKREVEGKQAGDVDAAFQDRRRRSSRPNTNGRSSRMPAWDRPARWSISRTAHVTCWSGTQKPHFVQEGVAAILQMPEDNVRVIWTTGPGSYGRNDADDAPWTPRCSPRPSAGRCALQYMRDQGTGWDPEGAGLHPHGARRDRRDGQCRRLGFPEQGLLPRRRQHQRQQAARHARRSDCSACALQSGDGFGVPERILRLCQQAHRLGDDRAAARSRVAAAHRAYARSGRAADPFRQRILHRRSGRGD